MEPAATDPQERIEQLRREHRALDEAVAALERRPHWSPDEELEVKRLKRLKLLKKDAITALARRLPR